MDGTMNALHTSDSFQNNCIHYWSISFV